MLVVSIGSDDRNSAVMTVFGVEGVHREQPYEDCTNRGEAEEQTSPNQRMRLQRAIDGSQAHVPPAFSVRMHL